MCVLIGSSPDTFTWKKFNATNILHFLSSFIPLSQLYSILQESYLKRQKHSGILLKNSTLKFFRSVKTLTWGWGWGQIIMVWQIKERDSALFSVTLGTSGLGVPDMHLVSGSSRLGLSRSEAGSSASPITKSTQQNSSALQVIDSFAERTPLWNVKEAHHTIRMWSLSAAL